MGLIDRISEGFSETQQRMDRCRYPLHFASAMFAGSLDVWRTTCIRRMALGH